MAVTRTDIADVLLFEPTPHHDDRGFFTRTFDMAVAQEQGLDTSQFVQDSMSRSHRGVVRGIHARVGAGEAKLVRCSFGAVFDVLLDLRPGSPTFLRSQSFELSDANHRTLYVPPGVAHAFQSLTEPGDLAYRIDRGHDPAEDLTIAYDDRDVAAQWPRPVSLVSGRDRGGLTLSEAVDRVRAAWPTGYPRES